MDLDMTPGLLLGCLSSPESGFPNVFVVFFNVLLRYVHL